MRQSALAISAFGPAEGWRQDDLVGVSRELDAGLVVAAYRAGLFPMPVGRRLTGWYSPLVRGILPLGGLRVSRSLRKMQARYETRVDTDFEQVIAACADRRRPGGWIDPVIARLYTDLHRAGVAHSVESWTDDGRLAGGLYGVGLGGLFAGESMFHRPDIGRDASKVALVALVELLGTEPHADRLLDVQWQTPHLASLGVTEVPRTEYLHRLARALPLPEPPWPQRAR